MIPRYRPTYSYRDLLGSYRDSFSKEIITALENRLKKIFNVQHVFLFEDGKAAITMLLKSINRPGEVLTPAYNCIAVPQAITRAGYQPRFVDAETGRFDVDPVKFRNAITSAIKILMPVHLFGIPWRMDEFYELYQDRGIPVVEDAAPAFGACRNGQRVGINSDALILSFHWTKPVSGETGGAVLTNNDALAGQIQAGMSSAASPNDRAFLFMKSWWRKLITQPSIYGLTRTGHSLLFGEKIFEVVKPEQFNVDQKYRTISPFSCALVLRQLDNLDKNLECRRNVANIYQQELSGKDQFILPRVPENSEPSWIQYPILVKEKLAFLHHMQKNGLDVTWSYRYSCPDTYNLKGFENSQRIAHEIAGLPTWPGLLPEEARQIGRIAAAFPG
ncbi:MAG: DegT/DnrJ/EryC1/StrS family aminotransferase [Chloroflexi bacterium]|nr:DegT/DnrJ/EryC1/StrS family aminotransferase [Chloroflexota bacterium]